MEWLVWGTGPGARTGGFSQCHGYHHGNTFRHLSWSSSCPGKGKQEVIHGATASRAHLKNSFSQRVRRNNQFSLLSKIFCRLSVCQPYSPPLCHCHRRTANGKASINKCLITVVIHVKMAFNQHNLWLWLIITHIWQRYCGVRHQFS